MTTSLDRLRTLTTLLAALVLAACRAAPPDPSAYLLATFEDATPTYVTPGALDVVVLVFEPGTKTIASGVVVAPDRLLTAAHVVDDLPTEAGHVRFELDGEPVRARVVDRGVATAPHDDWAVLAFERPRWSRSALVHPRALDPTWSPAADTELLLVGYAAGFFPDGRVDPDAPTPSVPVRVVRPGDAREAARAWWAVGEPWDLRGLSGGAAMAWNAAAERAELVGVFSGLAVTELREVTTVLGVPVASGPVEGALVRFAVHRLPRSAFDPHDDPSPGKRVPSDQ